MSNLKIVDIVGADKAGALAVLDDMRAQVLSGDIVAFAGASIYTDDSTSAFTGNVTGKRRLHFMGAVAHLLHKLTSSED